MRIDLHTHSTASDGSYTPAELIEAAAAAELDVVAITDHDTTRGWAEAETSLPPGLALVRGAELSCEYEAGDGGKPVTLHLLAYLFDPADPALAAEGDKVRGSRLRRGERMVELLRADGIEVTWEQVLGYAKGGTVGRPHVADALIAAGKVCDTSGAFTLEWIGTGGRYWVPKYNTDVLEAIGLVRAAGGVPVFAHPRAATRGAPIVDDAAIAAMAKAGLGGLEVDHFDHPPADREHLRRLAGELGLLVTGSSDFHGTRRPGALGDNVTHPAAYEAVVAQAKGCQVLAG